ncbi:MAG: SWIM zinc finger family protein [Myxococcota bacterium]
MAKTVAIDIDIHARDLRFLRAAETVLKKYELTRIDDTSGDKPLCSVAITGGRTSYVVKFHTDWSKRPTCSCPDMKRSGGASSAGGFCKHAIAAALKWEDLRCQLLDALI